MNTKTKNIISSILFLAIIIGFSLANIVAPDKAISDSERRELEQMPTLNFKGVKSGEFFNEFESYMLDQFVFRELFRSFKAVNEYYVLRKLDNNGIYIKEGYVSKLEYPLNEDMIKSAASKYSTLCESLFKECNIYYSVIPDKNYFLAYKKGFPCIDYDKIISMMGNAFPHKYIDIVDTLSLDDFYKTDLHWMQQSIENTANTLLESMGKTVTARSFEKKSLSPFYGSFFRQAALPIKADTLTYLTNDTLEGCTLTNPITGATSGIYELDSFGKTDSYDVFLSGAESLLVIDNCKNINGGTLFLIRDSFGSSIAPLLIESYNKIVLIDLRYITKEIISRYITVQKGSDVLFLSSAMILNRSYLFK